jgi:hypothetical protein
VAVLLQSEGVATASTWVASLLALAVAWLWGENLRNRRARWAAMEERAPGGGYRLAARLPCATAGGAGEGQP